MKKTFLFLAFTVFFICQLNAQLNVGPSANKMSMALFAIKNLYVEEVNENKLVEEGLKAMIKTLDPHSAYMTADEMKDMNEPLQGGFDGIGISFNMLNDTLFVVEVIAGGPSEKAGLLPGDRIVFVDDETIAGVKMPNSQVMKRLKGPKGTMVNLKIKRRGYKELLDYKIKRDKIPFYSVDASFMIDKKIGYIIITRFGASTIEEFRKAFNELKAQGMTDLVLDLQSNGGGLMNAAVDLADEFLSDGKLIVYTEGKHSPRMQSNASKNGLFETGRLIVLIDEYSASASEIVSGAVQDWDRGIIIGRRSFGKGLVQRPVPLPDGSYLKLTVSKYFTPSGRFIQKPYEDAENYSKDLIDRYNRGEMLHEDSIHFPDSLRTQTLVNKRKIYGGGGIMPDIFVPIDTNRMTALHRKLSVRGITNRFSMQYVDEHRKELQSQFPESKDFITNFKITESILNSLLKFAEEEKITIDETDRNSDKSLLAKQLKANMARDLWRTSEYYKVMWEENESLKKAIEILKDKKAYDEILKK